MNTNNQGRYLVILSNGLRFILPAEHNGQAIKLGKELARRYHSTITYAAPMED